MNARVRRACTVALLALPMTAGLGQSKYDVPEDVQEKIDEARAGGDLSKDMDDILVDAYVTNRTLDGKSVCTAKYAGFFAE